MASETKKAKGKGDWKARWKRDYTASLSDPAKRLSGSAYTTARNKLRAARGSAKEQPCTECGAKPSGWTLQPRRNTEILLDPSGLYFAASSEDYAPRCAAHTRPYLKTLRAKLDKKAQEAGF
jgi:hypothetical protein